jgi:hypothetical protein
MGCDRATLDCIYSKRVSKDDDGGGESGDGKGINQSRQIIEDGRGGSKSSGLLSSRKVFWGLAQSTTEIEEEKKKCDLDSLVLVCVKDSEESG